MNDRNKERKVVQKLLETHNKGTDEVKTGIGGKTEVTY
jgi:hypothetical protein